MKNEGNKRILLTGGHAATTAIAVVEELMRRRKPGDIYWIGADSAIEGKKIPTLDSKVLPKMGVKTFFIVSGRLQRKFTVWTIPSLFKIPVGIIQSLIAVGKIKPAVVLSLGGHTSFPVVFASWIMRIPVVVHEQTESLGLANRLSTPFVKQILLSEKFGNPVMTQVAEVGPKTDPGNPPTVMIMGGSRGSQIINTCIFNCLRQLTEKYRIIHITGELDYPKFSSLKNDRYDVYSWVDPLKIDGLYRQADMVVARAGANTVSELMIIKRPCVLIPIPWSPLNEQAKNAKKAEAFGIARIISQNELTSTRLINEINFLNDNFGKIVKGVIDKTTLDKNASKRIVDILENYLR